MDLVARVIMAPLWLLKLVVLLPFTLPVALLRTLRGQRPSIGIEPMILDVIWSTGGPIDFEMIAWAFERPPGHEVRGINRIRVLPRDIRMSLATTVAFGFVEENHTVRPVFHHGAPVLRDGEIAYTAEDTYAIADNGKRWFAEYHPERAAELTELEALTIEARRSGGDPFEHLDLAQFVESRHDPGRALRMLREWEAALPRAD